MKGFAGAINLSSEKGLKRCEASLPTDAVAATPVAHQCFLAHVHPTARSYGHLYQALFMHLR